MKWVLLPKESNEQQIYARVDDDGLIRVTCVEEHPELQQWIAQGNKPTQYKPE